MHTTDGDIEPRGHSKLHRICILTRKFHARHKFIITSREFHFWFHIQHLTTHGLVMHIDYRIHDDDKLMTYDQERET
jgi:hypothetical protein